jgi:hypothetical protein
VPEWNPIIRTPSSGTGRDGSASSTVPPTAPPR